MAQLDLDGLAVRPLTELRGLIGTLKFLPLEDLSGPVKTLIDRRSEIHPNEWSALAAMLAPATPVQLLLELLTSLESASSAKQTPALTPIVAEIARRCDDTATGIAWEQVLSMAEADIRWYFLEHVRLSLLLAGRLLGSTVAPIVADVVARLTACFP